jgi:ABC-2 type transport system ATP-binding protein
MGEPAPAIEVAGLTKRYGRQLAVDDLAMTVPAGVVAGFVGPNGAGKTTTMRMLLGLIAPTAGGGTVLGQPLGEPGRYLRRVGALIESPAFYPALTGRQNLAFLARLGGLRLDRVDAVLDMVALADRAGDPYRTYSAGMKQRLGIAAALLPEPELLVLDEPANGLDPAGIRGIRALLTELAGDGTTVLVSSHLLAEVEAVCGWVILLNRGRRAYQGTLDGLGADGHQRLVVRTVDPDGLAIVDAVARENSYATTLNGERVVVLAPADFAGPLNAEAMRRGAVISELTREATNLEERFFAVTDHEGELHP